MAGCKTPKMRFPCILPGKALHDMEDKIHLLYQQILCATKNGHDAEVRRDKDGNFVVYSVKKQRADKIKVK